ncbi:translation initiation factor IF-2 [uncultured Desulfobacterium sp.]|uniref:Translation initiation factor IF-2 n=1 Tax=uncultured Desulfobacterium sp. TaxID=201089 RepID=A0A445MZK0_9BACT|nr:translation initiation factor IF-2 [uncultured Desulfobacterium sp.]
MAKVRVYELAKELNIDSKTLVDKLQSSGMNVKNYLSTMDEADIKRARDIVSGVKSKVVEEKRVKPTVIRRRKMVKAQEEVHEAEHEEETPEGKIVPQPELTVAEVVEPQAPVIPVEPLKAVEPKPQVRPAPPVQGPIPAEKPAPSAEEISVEAEAAEEKQEVEIPAEKGVEPKVEAKPKPKKLKKKKMDRPARIIRAATVMAKETVTEAEEEEEVEQPVVSAHEIRPKPLQPFEIAAGIVEEEEEEDLVKLEKGKKGKKKETIEIEKRGKYRFRKKEVYERADLYEDRGIVRKGKKPGKKAKAEAIRGKQTEITVPKAIKRRIKVPEFVTISELAKAMGTKAAELIKSLLGMGHMANINQSIDFETASVLSDEFGYELELDTFTEVDLIAEKEDMPEDMKFRPPVVTIMGHVDHGKTLLLDYIRKSNIISEESGGITQHIGAYYVSGEHGDIVFLDTPGHEAFTAMRARGAQVTDIIVLVVAADDGVMPQTKEAIDHARAANIPIVVAINKIDKPDANSDKVKRDLATVGVAAEDWGGDTLFAAVSAKTGQGVDELLNLILLQAEMLELAANPNKPAKGTVIEAKLDKNKGPVATVLIKGGTLRPGDYFICGENFGRVRAMNNHRGKKMLEAGPSVPVEIYGISGVPMAGDEFIVVHDERTAKQISEHRKQATKDMEKAKKGVVSLEDLFERIKDGNVKELNIILKTDVQGSLEALGDLLVKQSTKEVKLNIIRMATGGITESDVMLASASNAIIIGFNIRANPRVSELAKNEKIDIRYYDVIYDAVKDIRAAMTGLLEPVFKENVIGRAFIKEVFHVPKVGSIAGCQVSDGHIERNAKVRLLRDDVVIFDGRISSLRRFKDDVREVQSGYECGIGLENYNDIKPGDVFEVYQMEEVEAHL